MSFRYGHQMGTASFKVEQAECKKVKIAKIKRTILLIVILSSLSSIFSDININGCNFNSIINPSSIGVCK